MGFLSRLAQAQRQAQGEVKYSTPEKIPNGSAPQPQGYGGGESRGGGAALRGKKFKGIS